MKHGVCGPAAGCNARNRIFKRLARDDLRRPTVGADCIHEHASGFLRRSVLLLPGGRHSGKLNGRNTENFAGHGHRVGRKLSAACPRARTGIRFECFKAGVVNLACCIRANAFKYVLNRNVNLFAIGAVQLARRDRSAVQHHAGNIETTQSHDDAGHIFVAAADADKSVEKIAAGDQFDRVGDHLARNQRSLHTLRAHRDAVGNGDGVELHRRTAGFSNAFLQRFSNFAQVHITGSDFGPGIGDADDRLMQIVFRESGSTQIRARRGAAGALG